MKKILLFLCLVILVGIGGWALGYCLSTAHTQYPAHSSDAMMRWLRDEYHLSSGQYDAVKKLHDEYMPKDKALMHNRDKAYDALVEALKASPSDTGKVAAAANQFVEAREACHANYNRHIQAVAAVMSPDAAERFLSTVKSKVRE